MGSTVYPKYVKNENYRIKFENLPKRLGNQFESSEANKSKCCCYSPCSPEGSIGIAGFDIIISSKAWLTRRLIWVIIVVVMVMSTTYQSIGFFRKFMENPVVTSFSQVARIHVPVPAVTVCHNSKFKKSTLEPMMVANTTFSDWLRHREFSLLDWDRFTVDDLISQASYNWTNMIYACFIDRHDCTDIGVVGVTRYSQVLGLCQTYKTERKVTESLLRGQVNLIFHETENLTDYENRGWTVVLHPHEIPFNDLAMAGGIAIAVAIEPKTSIEVRLTKKENYFIPKPTKTGGVSCVYKTTSDVMQCMHQCINYFSSYTQSSCHLPWKEPLGDQRPCTSYRDLQSAMTSNFTNDGESDIFYAAHGCGCTLPCTYTTLSLSVPYSKSLQELKRRQVIPTRSETNFGHFSLWIQSVTEVVNESRPYQWAQFSSDIGGILGLMLGASLLTLVEIIDYCICFCLSKFIKS